MEFVFWVESQHLKEQLFHARKYSGFWSLNSSVGSKSLLIIGDSQANYKLKEPTWGASKLCWPQGTKPTELAVDVGCGSGQGTRFLAERFAKVVGTDISQAQIQEAKAAPSPPNVSYLVCPAEELPFKDASVDLLASFTAAHWFDIEKFMREVNRVVRPGGCVAISTYTVDMSLHYGTCSEKLTQIFRETWGQLLKYSHNRVKHVLEDYKEIFEALPFPDKKRITDIYDKIPMTVAGVVGYLESASPYQVFMKNDPEAAKTLLPEMEKRLLEVMGVPSRETPLEFWVRHVCILGHKEA